MYIQQLYTNCLAEAAYYIESNGEAAIIDPMRETAPYLELAEKRNAKIKYIFETHFHADFVSGHIDLAKKTGALIVYGPGAKAEYDIYVARDYEHFRLGNLILELLHTPGHTLESSSILLYNETGRPYAVFTGDTLFVGDVGRPDLAVKSDLSREDLAGMLYDSLHSKITILPEDVILYSGHGAGSACGKNIGKETSSTIGRQLKSNYALQLMSREQFIEAVTTGLETPPKYFFTDAAINKHGYENIDAVLQRNTQALPVADVERAIAHGAAIIDVRNGADFSTAYIPGAVNIGLDGQYAVWAGSLLDEKKPIILVCQPGREQEAVLRLARIGYENVKGYLDGGIDAWKNAGKNLNSIPSVPASTLMSENVPGEYILDVRNVSETRENFISGAANIPLGQLENNLALLDKNKPYYVICAGGYRSIIACSLLKKQGFARITNVADGMNALKPLQPIEEPIVA